MKPSLITTNSGKFKIAQEIFAEYGVTLTQTSLETPEIQSLDNIAVAKYSSEFACSALNTPVLKSDVGYFVSELNGFPGPLVKFINETLSSEDLLRLMKGKENREIILRESLALSIPGKETQVFSIEIKAQIAKKSSNRPGSPFDKIIILPGFSKPKAEYSQKENHEFFKQNLKIYRQAADYISKL